MLMKFALELLQEDDRQPGMQAGQEQFPGRQILRPESGTMQGFLPRNRRLSILLVHILRTIFLLYTGPKSYTKNVMKIFSLCVQRSSFWFSSINNGCLK